MLRRPGPRCQCQQVKSAPSTPATSPIPDWLGQGGAAGGIQQPTRINGFYLTTRPGATIREIAQAITFREPKCHTRAMSMTRSRRSRGAWVHACSSVIGPLTRANAALMPCSYSS